MGTSDLVIIVVVVGVAVVDGIGELGVALSTLHAKGAEGGLITRLLVVGPVHGSVVAGGGVEAAGDCVCAVLIDTVGLAASAVSVLLGVS